MATSDFWTASLCRVRCSWPLLMCTNRSFEVPDRTVKSRSPSWFQVRNWNRTDNPSIPGSTGRDRKLLVLRKEVEYSWGSEQEKETLPWERNGHEVNTALHLSAHLSEAVEYGMKTNDTHTVADHGKGKAMEMSNVIPCLAKSWVPREWLQNTCPISRLCSEEHTLKT